MQVSLNFNLAALISFPFLRLYKFQRIQEEQCYTMLVPMKSRQGFSACREYIDETLEKYNTKLLVFNTRTTTVDSSG